MGAAVSPPRPRRRPRGSARPHRPSRGRRLLLGHDQHQLGRLRRQQARGRLPARERHLGRARRALRLRHPPLLGRLARPRRPAHHLQGTRAGRHRGRLRRRQGLLLGLVRARPRRARQARPHRAPRRHDVGRRHRLRAPGEALHRRPHAAGRRSPSSCASTRSTSARPSGSSRPRRRASTTGAAGRCRWPTSGPRASQTPGPRARPGTPARSPTPHGRRSPSRLSPARGACASRPTKGRAPPRRRA